MQDLDNTVGAWDMYGQEDQKRYPDLQNEFFERAAGGLSSRGAMLRFLAVGVYCHCCYEVVSTCILSSAASHGAGAVNVHTADMAMYLISTSTMSVFSIQEGFLCGL
jgi:hypothetical protein